MRAGWVALTLVMTVLHCRANVSHWNETVQQEEEEEEMNSHNCSRCVQHEEARALRIEAIKVQILSKLGLRQAPNITRKEVPSIPPLHLLLDRYGMQADSPFVPGPEYEEEVEDPYHLFAEKVISFSQEPPGGPSPIREDQTLYFKFSPSLYSSYVAKAHLWIYVKPNNQLQEPSIASIFVYQVARIEPNLLTIRKKKIEVKPDKGFWLEIDVRKVVSQWFHRPETNLGIVIHSYDQQGPRDLLVLDPADGPSLVPFIELRVEKSRRRRSKRMIGLNCEDNSSEVRCCRYPLTVDFEEFGWDWIIAPKRYEANYCSGECPYVFLQKYPHTHLVQQANPQGSAGPCCAPRKMSSISMLYFDEEQNIVYGMLPGMVVDRCGCL